MTLAARRNAPPWNGRRAALQRLTPDMRPKRLLTHCIVPLLAALLAVVAVRCLLVAQYAVPADQPAAGLLAGDRILVLRPAYGLRLPGTPPAARLRLGGRPARAGQVLAFDHPLGRGLCTALCTAVPGDTVWVDPLRGRVLPGRTSAAACPLVVPGVGRPVDVTPCNARLLHAALTRHEGSRVALVGDTALVFDGRPLHRAYFTQDYYWVEGSESRYGFVPQSHLAGRVLCVSYSADPAQPFYNCLRKGRFFRPVP